MRDLFAKPFPRFLAGFFFACFVFLPVMWVLFGPPGSLLYIVPIIGAGIAGGFWWIRRPPPIFYSRPNEELAGVGPFSKPATRFTVGFVSACLGFTLIVSLIQGLPKSFSFLAPTIAVGLVCGTMAARKSAALLW